MDINLSRHQHILGRWGRIQSKAGFLQTYFIAFLRSDGKVLFRPGSKAMDKNVENARHKLKIT